MSRPNIHDEYFLWLLTKINPMTNSLSRRSYSKLCSYLHNRWEFYWSVDYDENRQADGFDQRQLYLDYIGPGIFTSKQIRELMDNPVSVFEVLVAISERIDFNLDDLVSGPRTWKWFVEMIDNLSLADLTDEHWDEVDDPKRVDYIIQILLDRSYDEDGTGGLFPLRDPKEDQTRVELWYQMNAYLHEKHPI